MQPSHNHNNRCAYNWLIYDILDRYLQLSAHKIRGDLYDLGAGASPYKDFFLQYAQRYVSVDWSSSPHAGSIDILSDLNELLSLSDSVADTVVAISVLEHLRSPHVMLRESFRILRPGGCLIMQVPWQWWIHEAPHDFYRYTPYGLKSLLNGAGFEDIQISPQAGIFTTIALKLNYFSLRLIRGPRLMRVFLRMVFRIGWSIGQRTAPFLDRLDRNWALEAPGYFVTAIKLPDQLN